MRPAQCVALASLLVVAPLAAQRPGVDASHFMLQVGEHSVPLFEATDPQLQQDILEMRSELPNDRRAAPPPRRAVHGLLTIRCAREYEGILAAWRQDVIAEGPGKAARSATISLRDQTGRVVATFLLKHAWPRMVAESMPPAPGALHAISAELEYESLARTP